MLRFFYKEVCKVYPATIKKTKEQILEVVKSGELKNFSAEDICRKLGGAYSYNAVDGALISLTTHKELSYSEEGKVYNITKTQD